MTDPTPPSARPAPPIEEPAAALRVSLPELAPGLLRLVAGAWWRTTRWSMEVSVRAGTRVVRAAVRGEGAGELLHDVGDELQAYARRLLGPVEAEVVEAEVGAAGGDPIPPASADQLTLRERGAELLRRSADVRYEEPAHPAYARILDELAPDEARMLRFMYASGDQPAVDVRTSRPLGVGASTVAQGLSMIGAQAGCRYLDRVPAYLNNLHRLGLVWFSREPLEDPLAYQVLEAQPDVVSALHKSGRARTVRRSIVLTPFGADFCLICLPPATDAPAPATEAAPAPQEAVEAGAARTRPARSAPRPRPA
jgi:Abortive infection alpha